jgi:hypothetical protein
VVLGFSKFISDFNLDNLVNLLASVVMFMVSQLFLELANLILDSSMIDVLLLDHLPELPI